MKLILKCYIFASTLLVATAFSASISTEDLKDFSSYPANTQKLIQAAVILADKNLSYKYGSADEKNGGMDCSGTMNYLIKSFYDRKDLPRQSDQFYEWVKKEGVLHSVSAADLSDKEFRQLKPGDLMFWTGTYKVDRKIPITHVMLYLGVDKQDQPLMFGASDGRSYNGKKIYGVSIFDIKLPPATSSSKFIGYGCIPHLTCSD